MNTQNQQRKMKLRTADTDCLFWCAAIALLFVQLGNTDMWQSEDRWLEVAREMLLSGDYLHPRINGVLYFDKPLVGYWLVIACSFATGLNEWALRLPSALSALVALWATRDLARQLWGRQAACHAGWTLLTCLGFLQWARLGEADMANLAATIAAVDWYWRRREHPSFGAYAIFYLIIAIGAQCKGLTAAIVPALAILADTAIRRCWRLHVNAGHLLALILGACVYLSPFLFAAASAQGSPAGLSLVLRENVVRFIDPFDHTAPPYTYLIAIPRMLFPWSILFVFALAAGLRHRWRDAAQGRWLLATSLLIFVFFTASGSRRYYYILPILPYCALMIAAYLTRGAKPIGLQITAGALVLCGLFQLSQLALFERLSTLGGGSLPPGMRWSCVGIGALTLVAMALVAMALAATTGPRNSRRWFVVCTTGALVLLGGYFLLQQVQIDEVRTEADFARQLRPIVAEYPDLQVGMLKSRPAPKLLFYANMQPSVKVLESAADLGRFVADPKRPKLVLVHRADDAALPAQLAEQAPLAVERQRAGKSESDDPDKLRAWLLR